MAIDYKYLRFVRFKEFYSWQVSLYLLSSVFDSKYEQVELITFLKPIKRLIKKKNYDGSVPIVKKIGFDLGQLELRDNNTTGMDLYLSVKNELIVSKINFHQGAIALNPLEEVACSTHYQPFHIEQSIIDPKFLILVLRSPIFLNAVNAIKSNGIKNEFTSEQIVKLKIPLPSLNIQKKLVKYYNDFLNTSVLSFQKSLQTEKSILEYVLSELGIKAHTQKIKKGLQFVHFKDIERWGVEYVLNQSLFENLHKGKYPVLLLKDFLVYAQYGLSEKCSKITDGFPIIRMNNIENGELNTTNLKYLNWSKEKFKNVLLQKGDLLFNRTNSKELVGKTTVFDIDGDFSFASYIIRLKLDPEKVNVHYINYLFNSPLIRNQINLVSRQILGQANVNSQELREFKFPVPPISKQNEIVGHINQLKQKAKELKKSSVQLRTQALKDFENKLFQS